MVSVQRHDPVHRPAQDRVDHIVLTRHGEAHVQEVRRIIEIVARVDERLPDRVLVGPGADRGQLGDHADRGDLALPRIVDVRRVMVEGGHRADDTADDCHRVGVAPETAEEVGHLLVQHRVPGHPALEILELGGRRKLPVKQQVADLEIVGLLGELVDRVAAVEQLTLVAVDIGDRRLTGSGGRKARVIGEDAHIRVELADVDDRRAVHCIVDRQFDRLVVVGQCCGAGGRGVIHRLRPFLQRSVLPRNV